jgi:hypothetical protein
MATDQVRIRSLYEGLYRTVILFGLLIAAAWLFAVFSYYLSRKMGVIRGGLGHGFGWSGSQLQARQRAEAQQVSDYSGPQSCSLRKRLVLVRACIIANLTCGKRMQPNRVGAPVDTNT